MLGELSPRTQDKIVSYGELLSSLIISARFDSLGIKHAWKDSRQLIRTDSNFGHATVDFRLTNTLIRNYIDATDATLFIFPGFIAANEMEITTTLGRGGSDYTAAILAAAVDAAALEIWTDVSGMMTADPRLVSNPGSSRHISYQEAMELSHFGAKVIPPTTIQPVRCTRNRPRLDKEYLFARRPRHRHRGRDHPQRQQHPWHLQHPPDRAPQPRRQRYGRHSRVLEETVRGPLQPPDQCHPHYPGLLGTLHMRRHR